MPTTTTFSLSRGIAADSGCPASGESLVDADFLDRQLEIIRAGGDLDEVDDRRPERGLRDLDRADPIRRDDAVGARLLQFLQRILPLGARNDEQIALHHARREHRVDILGIGADRGHEAARALDAQALQRLFAAGVAFNREMARAVASRTRSALRSTITYGVFCRLNSFATIDPIRPKPQMT